MLNQPTPQEVKQARIGACLTLQEAAELIGLKHGKHWQRFECQGATSRQIPLHKWELFLLKTLKPTV